MFSLPFPLHGSCITLAQAFDREYSVQHSYRNSCFHLLPVFGLMRSLHLSFALFLLISPSRLFRIVISSILWIVDSVEIRWICILNLVLDWMRSTDIWIILGPPRTDRLMT